MCVAAVINGEGPSLDELKAMERINSDGAGLGWRWDDDDLMSYSRGLKATQIYEMLKWMPRPALLHFRYATHGPKTAAMCHPFPLGPYALTAKGSQGSAPAIVVHNGVWPKHHTYRPNWVESGSVSDTAVAAYMAGQDENILKDVDWSTVVARVDVENDVVLLTYRGRWFDRGADRYTNLNWDRCSTSKVDSPEMKRGGWSEYS